MDTCIFRSSHYIFAPIASIYQNELFIMNLSLECGTVRLFRLIRTKDTPQNVNSVKSQLLRLCNKI